VLVCMIFHGLNRFTVWVSRYAPCSRPECPPGYAKKLIEDPAINSFFCYAIRTLRTTTQAVQLRNLGSIARFTGCTTIPIIEIAIDIGDSLVQR